MKQKIRKQEGVPEEAVVEAPAEVAPELSVEDRLSGLEAKTDEILSVLQSLGKADEEAEPMEEYSEEEKAEDEDDDEEKKSAVGTDVSPSPTGGEVTLPKVLVGETDESASPENDKVSVMEKKMNHIKKARSITRSSRPGISEETNLSEEEKGNLGYVHKMMKDVREGRKTSADMNREIRDIQKANHTAGIKTALGKK